MTGPVVIVGGGLAAVRLAESLRGNGFEEPITIISAENHPPYDRPPLSKSVLLGDDDRVDLKPTQWYDDAGVDLVLGTRVTAVDPIHRRVTLEPPLPPELVEGSPTEPSLPPEPSPLPELVEGSSTEPFDGAQGAEKRTQGADNRPQGADNRPQGAESRDQGSGTDASLTYGTLVVATGLNPRPFPGDGGDLASVHLLRTYDDAVALRAELADARTAVVIGAGFIGCETAASLTKRGIAVTVVEPAATPLAAALGETVGALVARLHADAGVTLRTGTGVDRLISSPDSDRVAAVVLDDGTELAADLVVVGIGGYPGLDYLTGSSIALADRAEGGGIACDALGHTSAQAVYAIGDAANWADSQGIRHRVEHWNHAVDQAVIVAAEISGQSLPAPTVPYFWTDQHDLKVQLLGSPRPSDQVHVVEDDGRKFLAYYSRDGVLVGVVGAGRAGKVMKTRPLLTGDTPITDVVPPGQTFADRPPVVEPVRTE